MEVIYLVNKLDFLVISLKDDNPKAEGTLLLCRSSVRLLSLRDPTRRAESQATLPVQVIPSFLCKSSGSTVGELKCCGPGLALRGCQRPWVSSPAAGCSGESGPRQQAPLRGPSRFGPLGALWTPACVLKGTGEHSKRSSIGAGEL